MSVRRIEITRRDEPAFDGAAFGEHGPYMRLAGCLHMEADPAEPANAGIALIDRAPVNERGMIEYRLDFCLYTPVDAARGSGWIFYDFLNRGSQRAIMRINNAPFSVMPETVEQLGNAFLMREGHTVLWTAWQGNVEPAGGPMLADLPVVSGYTGMTREEVVVDAVDSIRGASISDVSDSGFVLHLSYPAADRDKASLSVRPCADAPRSLPEGVTWEWIDDRRIRIAIAPGTGIDRGAIHEFLYEARDPVVMGLGYAGIRDALSFFRHEAADAQGHANPLWRSDTDTPAIRRIMGFGLSQSGRVLRDFVWQGFNADLSGRPVFDGIIPIIGGSRKAWVNAPFSQPGRYSRQHEDHDFPGDQFPFTYTPTRDPVSGQTDDILARARAEGVSPKVMHLDTDSEVWSARGSLIVTDPQGQDIILPEDVRAYLAAGVAHGDYPVPSGHVLALPTNLLTYGSLLRALIAAMRQWVDDGIAPPPSAYPTHGNGGLMTLAAWQARFPALPAMPAAQHLNALRNRDHDHVPPVAGPDYPVFVPATDADGNTARGVAHPLLSAPLGTHAGWTVRQSGYAPGHLYSVYGAMLPFAPDQAARHAARDPRASFAERYGDEAGWHAALVKACKTLVADRLLLPEDAEQLLRHARPDLTSFGLI
ncbi:alpha/beta hydrolase domain-containing protein [Novosphingobium rosa]|uniref:alpha/beta hydrolase domain-containing protein n=1 Tax=Novosphingobium rosa TaxID=76978 RepID=UPI000831EAFD|nr:alpha/beta hydrolase domain-containing protein [Novosphingobium rosa]